MLSLLLDSPGHFLGNVPFYAVPLAATCAAGTLWSLRGGGSAHRGGLWGLAAGLVLVALSLAVLLALTARCGI